MSGGRPQADDEGVALLTLNRPDRLNAWTAEMEHAYFDLLQECAADPEVRVVVVTGAGRGFCAGSRHAVAAGARRRRALRGAAAARTAPAEPAAVDPEADHRRDQRCLRRDRARPGSDVRHPLRRRGSEAHDCVPRRGLVAEHGISWILPRLVGPARALDLLLSGRVVLAEEARELGIVNRVLAPERLLEATFDYARELAVNCSPSSMATMKRQVYGDLERGLMQATEEADRLMVAVLLRARLPRGRDELPRAPRAAASQALAG